MPMGVVACWLYVLDQETYGWFMWFKMVPALVCSGGLFLRAILEHYVYTSQETKNMESLEWLNCFVLYATLMAAGTNLFMGSLFFLSEDSFLFAGDDDDDAPEKTEQQQQWDADFRFASLTTSGVPTYLLGYSCFVVFGIVYILVVIYQSCGEFEKEKEEAEAQQTNPDEIIETDK